MYVIKNLKMVNGESSYMHTNNSEKSGKSKKVDLGRSSEIDLRSGRQKSTSTDRLRPTANTTSKFMQMTNVNTGNLPDDK